jgi:hypothetical protein
MPKVLHVNDYPSDTGLRKTQDAFKQSKRCLDALDANCIASTPAGSQAAERGLFLGKKRKSGSQWDGSIALLAWAWERLRHSLPNYRTGGG